MLINPSQKFLLGLCLHVFLISSQAQVQFQKGYYINEEQVMITGLIKNLDWKYNPTSFEFKKSEEAPVVTLSLEKVHEFGIDTNLRYKRYSVLLDTTYFSLNNPGKNPNPGFKESLLFLKVLVDGEASLYSHISSEGTHYFFSLNDKNPEPLM